MTHEFEILGEVAKVDEELGLVFGYAIVSKIDGADYFDKDGDNIPEASMLESACDFMLDSRAADDMHDDDDHGMVVFAFPLTAEIAKGLEISAQRTGLLIGMKPSAEVFEKFRSGERRQFSIGGVRIEDEEVAA